MTPQRLQQESAILEHYFPNRCRFKNLNSVNEFLDVDMQTQSGNVYRLNIKIQPDYPSSIPGLYIVAPLPLKKYDGSIIEDCSHEMHTLSVDCEMIQISHSTEHWNPNQTLYKIVMKARIWLEAYEGHLRTGKPINDYLNGYDSKTADNIVEKPKDVISLVEDGKNS